MKMVIPLLAMLILISCSKEDFKGDSGTFKDSRDGNRYEWVKIGTQIWMAENLAWLPSVSPSSNGTDTDPYYYVYGYEWSNISEAKATSNYDAYGVLYNWEAAMTGCPDGWHLPGDEEWKTLEKYLGMSESDANDAAGGRSSGDVGKKMKSSTLWLNNGNGDNSSGFNAFPGGFRTKDDVFYYLGDYAYFWSSSPNESSYAWNRTLFYYDSGVYRTVYYRKYGFSVRCIKNS